MTTKTKKILLTGASSGIGLAIAHQLLSEGHKIIGLANDFEQSPPASDDFIQENVDLSSLDHLPIALQQLLAQHSELDAIICCAGAGLFADLEDLSYEQIRSLMDLNFTSHAYLLKTFIPAMKQRRSGDIVLMGSTSALAGHRKGSIYCASKFALRGLAQALREETAPSQIRVTLINPGMVNTGFFDDQSFTHGGKEENYINVEDIANTVSLVVNTRTGTVFDEINLSPLTTSIEKKAEN